MEFEIFIKAGNSYEKRLIVPPSGAGRSYFEALSLTNKQQLETISNDIMDFSSDGISISLKRPAHEDYNIQEKLDKLIDIRKINLKLKEELKELLQEIEFIICDRCGNKMYRKPVGVSYKRFGNNYIIGNQDKQSTKYVYSCEDGNCHHFLEEWYIKAIEYNKQLREELIEQGKDFVPTDFGYWHYIDEGSIKRAMEIWSCKL